MPAAIGVSVVIPCHNAAAFLSEALQSVARQTFANFECIIIDDGSTDDSASLAKSFIASDPRFKLIEMPENRGAAAARNAGLAEACGRWIALLDADDLFLSDRLERLTTLGESRQADMVVDDLIVTKFPAVTPLYRAFGFAAAESQFTQEDFFRRSRVFRAALAAGYIQPLLRRALLERTGARYDPSVPSGEDFLFCAHLFSTRPRCLATNYAGYVYRRRPGSLSHSDAHLHVHAAQSDRLLSEFGSSLSTVSRKALVQRSRDFHRLAYAWPALAAVRTRRWPAAAQFLAVHPSVILTGFSLLGARVRRRWSARFRATGNNIAGITQPYPTPSL